jgi:enoyl-CoA hydratase
MSAGSARIGLTELRVGVPFPIAPLEIARYAVPRQHLLDVVYRGLTLTPEGAHACGLIDDVVAPESLIEQAVTAAQELAAVPRAAFGVTKEGLRRPALEAIERHADTYDDAVMAEWSSPEIVNRIRSYLERTLRQKQ